MGYGIFVVVWERVFAEGCGGPEVCVEGSQDYCEGADVEGGEFLGEGFCEG